MESERADDRLGSLLEDGFNELIQDTSHRKYIGDFVKAVPSDTKEWLAVPLPREGDVTLVILPCSYASKTSGAYPESKSVSLQANADCRDLSTVSFPTKKEHNGRKRKQPQNWKFAACQWRVVASDIPLSHQLRRFSFSSSLVPLRPMTTAIFLVVSPSRVDVKGRVKSVFLARPNNYLSAACFEGRSSSIKTPADLQKTSN